jgi:hypothetical protein
LQILKKQLQYLKNNFIIILKFHKEKKMLQFLKRRLSSQKGAMDKILVTLLLVIVGVGAVVGLSTWIGTETDTVQAAATTQITAVTANAAAGN